MLKPNIRIKYIFVIVTEVDNSDVLNNKWHRNVGIKHNRLQYVTVSWLMCFAIAILSLTPYRSISISIDNLLIYIYLYLYFFRIYILYLARSTFKSAFDF